MKNFKKILLYSLFFTLFESAFSMERSWNVKVCRKGENKKITFSWCKLSDRSVFDQYKKVLADSFGPLYLPDPQWGDADAFDYENGRSEIIDDVERDWDADLADGIEDSEYYLLCAFIDSEMVGFALFDRVRAEDQFDLEDGESFLDLLAVSPKAQGLGLSRKLIFSIVRICPEVKRLMLGTDKIGNRKACAIYTHLGFRPYDEERFDYPRDKAQMFEWFNPATTIPEQITISFGLLKELLREIRLDGSRSPDEYKRIAKRLL